MEEKFKIGADFKVFELMQNAGKNAPKEYNFPLRGDLVSMADQKELLVYNKFDVKLSDVYPVIKEENKKDAIELIWSNRISGWWLYETELLQFDICTKEEFQNALEGEKKEEAKKDVDYRKKKKQEDINTVPSIQRKLRL